MLSLGFLLKANSEQAEAALKKMEGAVSASTSAMQGDFSKASSGIVGKLTSMTPTFSIAAGAIASIGGAMIALANKSADAGDKMFLASQRTGTSVKMLGGLKLAAKEAGVSFDTVERGMERMTMRLSPFAVSGSQGAKALKSMGISAMDVHGKMRPMPDILGDIAHRFSHMKDSTDKTALAMGLFGRSGAQMIPMLDKGRAALQKMAQQEQDATGITQKSAEEAHRYKEMTALLSVEFTGLTTKIGMRLVPALSGLIKELLNFGTEVKIDARNTEAFGTSIMTTVGKLTHWHWLTKEGTKISEKNDQQLKKLWDTYNQGTKDVGILAKTESELNSTTDKGTKSTRLSTEALKQHLHLLNLEIDKQSKLAKWRQQDIQDNVKKTTQQQQQINGHAQMAKFSSTMMSKPPAFMTQFPAQNQQLVRGKQGWLDYTRAMQQSTQTMQGLPGPMQQMSQSLGKIMQLHKQSGTVAGQYNQALVKQGQAQKQTAIESVGAVGMATAGFIKSKRMMAVIEAIIQTAQGIADLAIFDDAGAAMHFASAAMWGIVAGTAGSSGGGGGGGRGSVSHGTSSSSRSRGGGGSTGQTVVGQGGSSMLSRGGGGGGNYHQSVVNIYGGQITDTNNLQNMVTALNQGGSTGTIRMNVAGTSATIPTPAY